METTPQLCCFNIDIFFVIVIIIISILTLGLGLLLFLIYIPISIIVHAIIYGIDKRRNRRTKRMMKVKVGRERDQEINRDQLDKPHVT